MASATRAAGAAGAAWVDEAIRFRWISKAGSSIKRTEFLRGEILALED
jgi:hypothetical protein